jgi:hypothetical protein
MTGMQSLTDDSHGRWDVTTASGSIYAFDFEARTVARRDGPGRPQAAPSDSLVPLRGIIELTVGLPGRWWVRNLSGGYTDPDQVWQYSSVVVSITEAADD